MKNESGIHPCGNHILVKPDVINEYTDGGIYIPPTDRERHQQSVAYGFLVAVGPDYCVHSVETVERMIDNSWRQVERKTTSYSQPFAEPGDRISFAIHSGREYSGIDGEVYRMMNDTDITGGVAEGVKATSLEARKPVSS